MNFESKNGRKRSFSFETNASKTLLHQGESVYSAQSWKERILLYESMFILIGRRTSILKMVEKQVFLMQPMHENHLSQQGECDYGAQS